MMREASSRSYSVILGDTTVNLWLCKVDHLLRREFGMMACGSSICLDFFVE